MGLLDQVSAYIDRFNAYKQANTPRNTRPAVSPAQVIDQGLLGGRIGQIPQRAEEMKQGLLRAPQDLANLNSPQVRGEIDNAMAGKGTVNPQQWMDAGMELSGMAPLGGLIGQTVYHGSPHKFDKFDMSKIGTGEGAQAYGHGLYFAENPAVADEYAGKLSDAFAYLGDKQIDHPSVMNALKTTQYGSKGDAARNALDNLARFRPEEAKAIGYVDRFKTPIDIRDAGNLYKVDIPDEAIPRMLDWDKPLSEQHPDVQAALEKYANSSILENQPKPLRGGDVYSSLRLGEFDNDAAASAMLKQAGIPGIRYLDGSSRTAGQGTSNYVLFDDQLPRILEVNGQPTGLLPWADEAKKVKKK